MLYLHFLSKTKKYLHVCNCLSFIFRWKCLGVSALVFICQQGELCSIHHFCQTVTELAYYHSYLTHLWRKCSV